MERVRSKLAPTRRKRRPAPGARRTRPPSAAAKGTPTALKSTIKRSGRLDSDNSVRAPRGRRDLDRRTGLRAASRPPCARALLSRSKHPRLGDVAYEQSPDRSARYPSPRSGVYRASGEQPDIGGGDRLPHVPLPRAVLRGSRALTRDRRPPVEPRPRSRRLEPACYASVSRRSTKIVGSDRTRGVDRGTAYAAVATSLRFAGTTTTGRLSRFKRA